MAIFEDQEQQELLSAIEAALKRKSGPAIFMDLHTTSAEGAPFALISDTLTNRDLALNLGVPIILGLEETIEGTILNFINDLGYAAFGFEAGQHQSPVSLDLHEAAVWMILQAAGCLESKDVPDLGNFRKILAQAVKGLPTVFEVRYRHALQPDDEFVMEPWFTNFEAIEKGELLARDRFGEIRANERGWIFMPLYQKQGEDGFFVVRAVKPIWLKVSAWMRKMGLDRLLPYLPGVNRHPNDANELIVDTRVAKWMVLEICHLLGYRKHSSNYGLMTIGRRKQHLSA